MKVLALNPVHGHQVLRDMVWPQVKALTTAGHEVEITVAPREDDRSVQQNRFYWGVVLKEISDQARLNGTTYSAEAWHELFKRQLLGYEIKKVPVAGRKRPTVIRRLKSTTDLKVRAMSKYLEQAQAFAVSELGVRFSAPDWMSWSNRDPASERIDPDTGEVLS